MASKLKTAQIENITEAKLVLADNATLDASTSKHGFLKKLSNVATEFMNGQGNWATPPLGNPKYYCKAYASGALTIGNGAYPAAITFDSEVEDAAGMHSTSTNTERLVCQSAGIYLIIGSISWNTNAAGFRDVEIWKNSTVIAQANCFTNSATYHTINFASTLINLAVNDYVWESGYQDTGGNLATDGGQYVTYLSAIKVSEA